MFENKTKELALNLDSINFSFDGFIYNPLDYAWDNHKKYLENYLLKSSKVLFLGMNPGPFGMVQTGVPFGEVNFTKNYLKIDGKVSKPEKMHEKRQILGLDYPRSEVSGRRVWTFFSKYYPDCRDLFSKYSVMNYCPLAFVDGGKTGKNITPDKLSKEDQVALSYYCDNYLMEIVEEMDFDYLIGIGRYAEKKLNEIALRINYKGTVGFVLHPSPMNPSANKGDWGETALNMIQAIGAWYD